MKLSFDEKGYNYIEIKKLPDGMISIVLSSQDANNYLKTIVNSVRINKAEFKKLTEEILKGD